MLFNVFSVFDQKAKAYLPPFFLPEVGQAVRVFRDCCNDAGHAFGKHPEDYVLFKVGEFDDRMGVFDECRSPELVMRGVQGVGLPVKEFLNENS